MRIHMHQTAAHPVHGCFEAGKVYDHVDDEFARQLIEAKAASVHEAQPAAKPVETAALDEGEKAADDRDPFKKLTGAPADRGNNPKGKAKASAKERSADEKEEEE